MRGSAHPEVVRPALVLTAHQKNGTLVVNGAFIPIATVSGCCWHVAQSHASAWPVSTVGLRTMHQVDVVQRDLAGFQFDVNGIVFVVTGGIEFQRQRNVTRLVEMVGRQRSVGVGSR